ncbi:DUF4365 domain-containing protein [Bradyrhizobium ottawaense]|uniref:DUF4365 domain-containing protein n=1 Tax=Bradyrhizobium ottawaense TaxID=931866 RepID=UPI001BA7931D|nr:DUF4365 domain-containing protein [Bradyrhizobium ottawaense]MBR1325706.1 DUF4365 domain-containing protein [Bradyrhizobium ottawaense]
MTTKKRSEQHLTDQAGEQLLRSRLPRHWVLREYRPDYGLDFTLETFKTGVKNGDSSATYETLGEHIFIQLKSISAPEVKPLTIYGRGNVEKAKEVLNRDDKVTDLETYRFQLEVTELATVERMGIAAPVLLVIADLSTQRCSFVCLNDYIDKILVPRHEDFKSKESRTIHVPVYNEIGTDRGLVALRWYAKRAKLLAAFQRFTYQFSELQWAEHDDWRSLAELFAKRIITYDFWDDTEMCGLIPYNAAGLQRFIDTGQPGFIKPTAGLPSGFDPNEMAQHLEKMDVFELWRQLSLLPKTHEDVWREWFLPTALGYSAS